MARTSSLGDSCESETSWAWISPQGKVIAVDNHQEFAWESATPTERVQYAFDDLDSESGYLKVPRYILRGFLEALAKDLTTRENPLAQSGMIYTIPEAIALDAQKRGLPTLSKGSWGPRERLTSSEEKFLRTQGVFPERTNAKSDTPWNRKTNRLWDRYLSDMLRFIRRSANRGLERQGWIPAGNAYSIGGSFGPPTPKQMEAFFRAVLECWKKQKIFPPVEKEDIWVHDRTYTYADALEMFASDQAQEAFYEHLMGARYNTPTQQERYELYRSQQSYADIVEPRVRLRSPSPTPGEEKEPKKTKKPERYPSRPGRPTRRASPENVVQLFYTDLES